MSSSANEMRATSRTVRRPWDLFLAWNRRSHYYMGLYLLFFCWLFAFTGLLLNHPEWQFAQFWPNRVQSSSTHAIRVSAGQTDAAHARDLMRQLGLEGEVQWPSKQPAGGALTFQVNRPGLQVDVKADFGTGRATVGRTELNAWGILHLLHTFSGVRADDPANERDWILTKVWALTMDAIAVGLVLMVGSSYIMWYRLPHKRWGGALSLALGLVCCLMFVAGFRWLS